MRLVSGKRFHARESLHPSVAEMMSSSELDVISGSREMGRFTFDHDISTGWMTSSTRRSSRRRPRFGHCQ